MHSDVALSPVTREITGGADVSPAVGSVQAFTARLYGLLATEHDNLVCSPYSVAVALAMTRNGARGRTAEEMDAVLQGPSAERLDAAMNALAQRLEDRAGTLDVACSLWGQRDLRWEEPFLDALARHYGAGMRLVDYRSDPDGAARQVSAWTSDATHGKIPELIPAGVLDDMTRLVLVNAVYFKGTWAERFDSSATQRRPFTLGDGSRVDVDMMSEDLHRATYCSTSDWTAVRLDYVGRQTAMAVVVPSAGVSLATVEAGLCASGLAGLLTGFRPAGTVHVELPRWRFRVQALLNESLSTLGMPTAFDPMRADLSALTTQERLHISHVLHEAFIVVDEAGTEAAAATGVVARAMSLAPPPALSVVADRPFMFVLFDVETTTPLFVGRVCDPIR